MYGAISLQPPRAFRRVAPGIMWHNPVKTERCAVVDHAACTDHAARCNTSGHPVVGARGNHWRFASVTLLWHSAQCSGHLCDLGGHAVPSLFSIHHHGHFAVALQQRQGQNGQADAMELR